MRKTSEKEKTASLTATPIAEMGPLLRRLRKASGKTIPEMEKLANISAPSMSKIERGQTPISTKIIQAYADALGLTVYVLVAMDEQDMKRLIEAGEKTT